MVDGLLRRGFVHTLHSHRGREVQMERRELAAAAERERPLAVVHSDIDE